MRVNESVQNIFNNIQIFLKKRGKCYLGKGTILYPESKIINNSGVNNLISIAANSHIRGELLIFGDGGKINIGSYCYVGEGTRIWSSKEIIIRDRVLISHNVNIFDNLTHPVSATQRHQQFKNIISKVEPNKIELYGNPVNIEKDVLIGCMSVILKGVTIGEGAIIGAGSIVTKDVPPWTIVAGNPAKIVREIPERER